jgi:hydroxymethyl cephem carbamoyltransferase
MALAGFGNPRDAAGDIGEAVERILKVESICPAPKHEFRDAPFYNAGVESDAANTAAALLTERIFELFLEAAARHLPAGLSLRIAGGCGLNCDVHFIPLPG